MKKGSLAILFSLAFLGTIITSCGSGEEAWSDGEFNDFVETIEVDPNTLVLDKGEYHTAEQAAYIQGTWDTITNFAYGLKELSKPRGITLESTNESTHSFSLSTDENFDDESIAYTVDEEGKVNIQNLLSDTTYYYVENVLPTASSNAEISSFHTSNLLPRNLSIDGITNVRDLGGYESKLGGKIKQGLFYRGGKLTSGHQEPTMKLTEKGLKTLRDELGVKTEIDLRTCNKDEPRGPENGNMYDGFIPGIKYISIPMMFEQGLNVLEQEEQIKKVFDVYSNPENYPIYVHCSIGTDRTGCISYLMGALLGMTNEELHTDYLFSNFGDIGSRRTIEHIESIYYPYLLTYKKSTLQKCVEAYLLDIGITKNQIKTIKNIMLEK